MASVALIVALASPLIHARLRAELSRDPDICILCDTDNPLKAAQEIAAQRPDVVLVDREMVTSPAMRQIGKPLPSIVFVTVHREGAPVGRTVPIAGTITFDARSGEIARILHAVVDAARGAKPAPGPLPSVVELKSRFTITRSAKPASPAKDSDPLEAAEAPLGEKAPVPSKTSQLMKTGFLRSVFDVAKTK